MKLTDEKLKWVAVDLDFTIAKTSGYPDFKLLEPMPGAKDALHKLTDAGWKITIHTSRPSADYETIESWCEYWNIPFRRIECGKLLAKYYVDDRAIEFHNDWDEVYKKIF